MADRLHDRSWGWSDQLLPPPKLDRERIDAEAFTFRVEAVEADIRNIIRSRPGGGVILTDGEKITGVQLPDHSPEIVTVADAVRRGWLG